MKKSFLIMPFLLVITSCGTTQVDKTSSTAAITYIDLSQDDERSLVEQYWTVKKRVEPRYPIQAAKKNISGCVDLIVGINEEGKLQGYKIKSSYPKGVFDKHAAAALGKWSWEPTSTNIDKKPVLTSIRLDFMMSLNIQDIDYLAHCPKRNS